MAYGPPLNIPLAPVVSSPPPRPTVWNCPAVNVARNSIDVPGPYVIADCVFARPPSTTSCPDTIVGMTPPGHATLVQFAGKATNSAEPAPAASATSPSSPCWTATPVTSVPPEKSATVVSV